MFGENLTTLPLPRTEQLPARIQIQAIEPIIDCGRYAPKRTVGDRVDVYATVFKDGHDVLGGAVRVRGPGERAWREVPLEALGNDRFGGSFVVDTPGRWQFAVAAWTDRIATWQDELRRKLAAGQEDLAGELAEGAALLGRRAPDRRGRARGRLDRPPRRGRLGPARGRRRSGARALRRVVRAVPAFVRWRSAASRRCCRGSPSSASTSSTCRRFTRSARRTAKARTTRSSPGPTTRAHRGRSARPRAATTRSIPTLGTWADFDALVAAARNAGIELALDFAIQCSPDHPWLREHPEWFNRRPDGTLKYAENPPKRYQDIYNVNFESRGLARSLAGAARRRARLGRARDHGLPRRQSAHEADGVLGVADHRRCAASTRR